MNLTITCPDCQRTLRVPESLLGQAVKCPSCAHVFTAPNHAEDEAPRFPTPPSERLSSRPAPPPEDDYDDEPRPSRRPRRDDYDDDAPRRRRGTEKPGKVLAIAIMILIGGILATLYAVIWFLYIGIIGATSMGIGLVCCFWPGPYYALVLGIMGIIKGPRLLGEKAHQEAAPRGLGIMMIINIVNFDVYNLVLGIIVLVFLADEEVKDYFHNG
jgi:predicted Zn finger-like uncharacterized protein